MWGTASGHVAVRKTGWPAAAASARASPKFPPPRPPARPKRGLEVQASVEHRQVPRIRVLVQVLHQDRAGARARGPADGPEALARRARVAACEEVQPRGVEDHVPRARGLAPDRPQVGCGSATDRPQTGPGSAPIPLPKWPQIGPNRPRSAPHRRRIDAGSNPAPIPYGSQIAPRSTMPKPPEDQPQICV